MILRIHIIKQDFHFEPTNLFQCTGLLDYDKFDNLLSRIKYWIRDEVHYFSLLDHGGIAAFRITENKHKYEFELFNNKDDKIPQEDVKRTISNISSMSFEQILEKDRHYEIYKPRVVLFSALRFFSKMSTTAIELISGYNHATILNSCKALSEFIYSNDDITKEYVNKMSIAFNNTVFLEVACNNKYPKN